MIRFFLILASIAGLAFGANQLIAKDTPAGWETYSADSFKAAQNAGDTIVVDVYATWCPTCRAQAPILNELRKDARLKNTRFVKVNFDKHKSFLREHRIPRQSTILVFKGKTESGRSIAQTNRGKLRTFVLSSI